MKVTYYGHSCFSVEVAGKTLLFDPFVRPNELAKAIDIKTIRADYILVTHGHWDHIDDAVDIAKNTDATVIAGYEVAGWLEKQGVKKTHPLNHGGGYKFDFGRVKFVNAVHSSSLPDGSYGGNPGGFVVETEEGDFYNSGDTALTKDMELIGEIFPNLRFAALPIGDNFTMGVEDAIRAAGMVGCMRVLGLHYDTFPPIRIDHEQARRLFTAADLQLHLLAIGETQDF